MGLGMSGPQALCKAEDPEDIRAATKAKAEQVAELAEFNENIPLDVDDRPSKEEEEEMSKAEQEIASLVEQVGDLLVQKWKSVPVFCHYMVSACEPALSSSI